MLFRGYDHHLSISLQEIDRFDDLDGLLKNRGFLGVHKVQYICLSQKPFSLICIGGAFSKYLILFRVGLEKRVMVVLYSGKRNCKFIFFIKGR